MYFARSEFRTRALRISSCIAFVLYVLVGLVLPIVGNAPWGYLAFFAFVPLGILVFRVRDTSEPGGIALILCLAEGFYVQVGLQFIMTMIILALPSGESLGGLKTPLYFAIMTVLPAMGLGVWVFLRSQHNWPFGVLVSGLCVVWQNYALREAGTGTTWDLSHVLTYVIVCAIMTGLFRREQRRRLLSIPPDSPANSMDTTLNP